MRVGVEGPQSSVKTAGGANPDVPTLRMQACDEPPTRATLVAELSVVVFASAIAGRCKFAEAAVRNGSVGRADVDGCFSCDAKGLRARRLLTALDRRNGVDR